MQATPYRVKKSPISNVAKGYIAYKKSEADQEYKKTVLGLKKTELDIEKQKLSILSQKGTGMTAKEAADVKLNIEKHEQTIKEYEEEPEREAEKVRQETKKEIRVAKRKEYIDKQAEERGFNRTLGILTKEYELKGGLAKASDVRKVAIGLQMQANQAARDVEVYNATHPEAMRSLEQQQAFANLQKTQAETADIARKAEHDADMYELEEDKKALATRKQTWAEQEAIINRQTEIGFRQFTSDSAMNLAEYGAGIKVLLHSTMSGDAYVMSLVSNMQHYVASAMLADDPQQKKDFMQIAKNTAAQIETETSKLGNKISIKIPITVDIKKSFWHPIAGAATMDIGEVAPQPAQSPQQMPILKRPVMDITGDKLPEESQKFIVYMEEQIAKQGKEAVKARWEQVKSKYTKEEQEIIESMLQ